MSEKASVNIEIIQRILRHLKVIYRELLDFEFLTNRFKGRFRFVPKLELANDIAIQKSSLKMLALISTINRREDRSHSQPRRGKEVSDR